MANPVIAPELHPTPESEAKQLLALQGERGLKGAIDVLMQQFQVLQTRAQIMLTITTLTLTEAEAEHHPLGHVISRAVGVGLDLELDAGVVSRTSAAAVCGWSARCRKTAKSTSP